MREPGFFELNIVASLYQGGVHVHTVIIARLQIVYEMYATPQRAAAEIEKLHIRSQALFDKKT